MTQVEAREYGPESTPAEILAIQERLYMVRPGVVMYREVPIPTPFQIRVFAEKLARITAGLGDYAMILDLTQARPPGKRCREALRELFAAQAGLRRVVVVTGGNFILNGIAKLLLRSSGVKEPIMCRDEAEALARAQAAG